MPVEFVGIARTSDASETVTEVGAAVQADYLHRLASTHERSGFDRVLITTSSSSPDGFVVADQVLNVTRRLGVLIAHRPGFVAPVAVARTLTTLDALHPGRVAVHIVTGGEDADQARDGDFADKRARYRRTGEFLDVVALAWDSQDPFDYAGEFYRVEGAWPVPRPAGPIPVYFGGASEDAVRVGGRHADIYAFWGEPLAGVRERIGQVRASAAAAGRVITRFSVSLRPIAAETEAAAWARARQLLEIASERATHFPSRQGMPQAEGARRLLRYASAADLHDARLWTALVAVTGAPGNSTALVGSYEQVAQALLEYVKVGATTLLIRGYDPLADAVSYARLIELVHDRVGMDVDGYRARAAAA